MLNAKRFTGLAPTILTPADHARIAADRAMEEERWRKACSIAVIGTVLLHFLAMLLLRDRLVPAPVVTRDGAAGPPMGDVRPAGGGSGLTMVDVRIAPPEQPRVQEEVAPVPEPVPVVEPEEVVIEEPVEEPAPAPEAPAVSPPSSEGSGGPGTGGQGGTTAGPGTGSGDGLGGGGTGDAGVAEIIPPKPRGIFIPPPGRPASARGQEITVWVFVSAAGRVDRNTVRLEPPTSDPRYNQRLIESVAEWVFDPARQGGEPVSVWYPFQIIL